MAFVAGVAGLVALVYYPDVVNLIEQLQRGQVKGGLFADNPIVGKSVDEWVRITQVVIPTSHYSNAVYNLAAEEQQYEPWALQH